MEHGSKTSPAALYYMSTLSPMLDVFTPYYSKTADADVLKKLLALGPLGDGEFGESLSLMYFKAYMQDKKKFKKAMFETKSESIIITAKQRVVYGLQNLMPQLLASKGITGEDAEKAMEAEINEVRE